MVRIEPDGTVRLDDGGTLDHRGIDMTWDLQARAWMARVHLPIFALLPDDLHPRTVVYFASMAGGEAEGSSIPEALRLLADRIEQGID
jgi:hypothetical protein